jgi:hypothetical protein
MVPMSAAIAALAVALLVAWFVLPVWAARLRAGALPQGPTPGLGEELSVRDVKLSEHLVWSHRNSDNRFVVRDKHGRDHVVDMAALAVLQSQINRALCDWVEDGYDGLDRSVAVAAFRIFGERALGVRREFQIGPEDGEPLLYLTVIVPNEPSDLEKAVLTESCATCCAQQRVWVGRRAPSASVRGTSTTRQV